MRNKNATGKFSSLLGEVKNKDRVVFPIMFKSKTTSNKEIEDNDLIIVR